MISSCHLGKKKRDEKNFVRILLVGYSSYPLIYITRKHPFFQSHVSDFKDVKNQTLNLQNHLFCQCPALGCRKLLQHQVVHTQNIQRRGHAWRNIVEVLKRKNNPLSTILPSGMFHEVSRNSSSTDTLVCVSIYSSFTSFVHPKLGCPNATPGEGVVIRGGRCTSLLAGYQVHLEKKHEIQYNTIYIT